MSDIAVIILSVAIFFSSVFLGSQINDGLKAYSCGSNPYLLYCKPYTDTQYFRERISYE